ncbi:glutamine-dependent NAD(+) synthetase with GAT domain-containing protein [Byssothecium circinans]|uniref:Glutamine-dependent NAD(+) synthetase n=1 Tax=Byssothecium circinans TaxID=147558 RepID=A0A6A5TX09_9PLEO|nr:glutamine-dependent NAD(+) synthetase with GAT domain-containing protein [Byssothecium circinans]
MTRLAKVAVCSLNQWVLDWYGNYERIRTSIVDALKQGAKLRVGPELELCGYGLLDHFLENDVYDHALEFIARILSDKELHGIVIDLGAPISHNSLRYNCRVLMLNGRIILIRPKLSLANDGNYRESRYFTPWKSTRHVEQFLLPPGKLRDLQGARTVPIGDALIRFDDTLLGVETCEELFTPMAPHIEMGLCGAEIFSNASGSHATLHKLHTRLDLILGATNKSKGVYLYSNQSGCDGDRLYFDASAMIIQNGKVIKLGSQFSLKDVETLTAVVDLDQVRSERYAPSRGLQATACPPYPIIDIDFGLSSADLVADPEIIPKFLGEEEEIGLLGGAWLFDYLRRSGAAGFLIPLSGGLDSCSTAMLVFSMCRMVCDAIKDGNETVIADVRRIAGPYGSKNEWLPKSPEELCSRILHTVYMGMSKQSSAETRGRANRLSQAIGSHHIDLDIDEIYHAQRNLIVNTTGYTPNFRSEGGTETDNLALQNIQARIRMVTAYSYAQTLPSIRKRRGGGGLLVLGSSNVDEVLYGYYTKYDASSADINPIGSISKTDLKKFLTWAGQAWDIPILEEFLNATPTAELEPLTSTYVQSDEADMQLTYDELSAFGTLRKVDRLGPFGCFQRLCLDWSTKMSPSEVAAKTKRFFSAHYRNRHKTTTLTPSLFACQYSPDDNRFDMRPFLYPPQAHGYEFELIDAEVERLEKKKVEGK